MTINQLMLSNITKRRLFSFEQNDPLPQEEIMYQKWFILLLIVGLVMFQCKTNPASDERGDITGIWKVTSYNGEAVGISAEGGSIYVIEESSMTIHESVEGCYDVSRGIPYSLSGDKILGKDFNHSETDVNYSYSHSTTYSISGDKLIIKMVSKENDQTFTETYGFQRYSGTIPPAGWTNDECN